MINQNFKYNGVEHVKDLGLNLNMTLFRPYDPALGRFTGIDYLADFFVGINPYSFGFNNPITFGDPDGLGPLDWLKKLFKKRRNLKGSSVKVVSNKTPKRKKKKKSGGSNDNGRTKPNFHITGLNSKSLGSPEFKFNPLKIQPIVNLSEFDRPSFRAGDDDVVFEKAIKFRGERGKRFDLYLIDGNTKTINDLVKTLTVYPQLKLIIIGNTSHDSKGGNYIYGKSDNAINQTGRDGKTFKHYMKGRAEAVKSALIEMGIDANRLSTGVGGHYYGKDRRTTTFKLVYPK